MNPEAWCGHCGETFRLSQVIEEGEGGRCPRCGIVFSHDYNAVVTTAVREFLAAAELMDAALRQLTDMAPLLHVDRDTLYKSLDTYLQR